MSEMAVDKLIDANREIARLKEVLRKMVEHDCSPDTMGQCMCCPIFRDMAADALKAKT